MVVWLLQQFLHMRKAVKSTDTPRQLALGLALGMLLGLMPKGNLVAATLSMLLLSVRVNISIGMLSAVAFSLLSPLLDPMTHRIGLALLQHETLKPTWIALYRLPLVPWTAANNTVVLGNLVLGLTLFYPSYRLGWKYFERRRARAEAAESEATTSETNADATSEANADATSEANAEASTSESLQPKAVADRTEHAAQEASDDSDAVAAVVDPVVEATSEMGQRDEAGSPEATAAETGSAETGDTDCAGPQPPSTSDAGEPVRPTPAKLPTADGAETVLVAALVDAACDDGERQCPGTESLPLDHAGMKPPSAEGRVLDRVSEVAQAQVDEPTSVEARHDEAGMHVRGAEPADATLAGQEIAEAISAPTRKFRLRPRELVKPRRVTPRKRNVAATTTRSPVRSGNEPMPPTDEPTDEQDAASRAA